MNQFIQNHPTFVVLCTLIVIISLLSWCLTLYAVISDTKKKDQRHDQYTNMLMGIIEQLRTQITEQSKRILNLLADKTELDKYSRSIEKDYISLLEEQNLRQNIKVVVTDKDIESAVKAFNKGNKDFPLIPFDKEPKISHDKIEDMATELHRMFKECKIIIDDYPKVVAHNLELKRSFDNHTEYSKKIEKENKDLKTMYRKCVEENEQLKERAKRLQETIEHKRHSKKEQKETGWYTPKNDVFDWFKVGEVYEQCQRTDGTFSLYRYIDGKKRNYVVDKSWFTPAPVPIICVKEHQKGIASESN